MTTMALEPGDAATWAGSAVALLMAVFAVWQQRQQNKGQAEADALARQQLDAAERRALTVEENLQRLIAELPTALQGLAQAQLATVPVRHAASVSWELTRPKKNMFVMRNTGTETGAGVKVDIGDHPAGLTRRLPEDAVVRAGESTEFMIMGAWGSPVPRELRVSWDGCDEPAVLPVPQ